MNLKPPLLTLIALLFISCTPNNPSPTTHQKSNSTQAILKLDTKGHTGKIRDIVVSKSGDILSASDDKTIRVWDSKTGKEKRKILGQIGAGREGMIYAIALSPNEKFLAVGGVFTGKKNSIRIYNYKTGVLLKILKSHTNVITDLAFSRDGNYLISGSADKTAKIWKSERDFRLVDTISFHTKTVYAVKIIEKRGDYFAVIAGDDKKIELYNMQIKEIVNSHKLSYTLHYLATSQENIAVCGYGRFIKIYDFNLNPIKTILSGVSFEGVAYSSNGKLLRAGFFLDTQTAVTGSGNNYEIYIWNIKKSDDFKKIEGVGKRVWSVGVRGDTIAWGNEWTEHYGKSKLQKSINLKNFQLSGHEVNSMFNRVSSTYKNYSLKHRRGGDSNYDEGVLDIKRNGKREVSIVKGLSNGLGHRCYGFYKNNIVSSASHGFLKIYNLQGKEVANLVGHIGEVWSIALDGDRLVSGSGDQTIRVWDLSKLKVKSEKLKINEYHLSQKVKEKNLTRDEIIQKAKIDNNLYNYIYIAPTIQPQLSLFITKNNDWIAWTPEGFYDASKGGEQYIGYHINHGSNHEAEFLNISRFRKQFYRPDLIQKALNGEDLRKYAKDIDIDALLKAGLPPKVKILNNKSMKIDEGSKEIDVKVCDMGGGFDNLNFYVDGKPIKYLDHSKAFNQKKKQVKNCLIIEQAISIPSGKHNISFNATNKEGNIVSNTPSIMISNTQKAVSKPNLHLLTLSISDYKDDALDLKYPNNDAKELAQKLKEIGKPIFSHVYNYALKDKEVTKEQIDRLMHKISSKVGVNDVFVLYLSGHGITNDKDGDYYFIPYDCPNGADVRKRAINQDRFKKIMSQIKAIKSVILLDTCQSGSMASKELVNTSVNRFGGNVGSAIIAGATSKQNAIDGYKKHGIFTYTVLEAMTNKKVYSFDDKLSINEVAEYAKYLLPKLAKEKFGHIQKPIIYLQGDTTFAIGGL